MDRKELIDILKAKVEGRVGRTLVTPTDFYLLIQQMQKEMGESLGLTTVKRVWNYVVSSHRTSVNTLSCLARFIGYRDWEGFVLANTGEEGEEDSGFFSCKQFHADDLAKGDVLEFAWEPNRFCRVVCLGDGMFRVLESRNGKLRVGDNFRGGLFSLGLPLCLSDLHRDGRLIGSYVAGWRRGLSLLNLQPRRNQELFE